MHALPTGAVTFLFTDVEGSARVLGELGAEHAAALVDVAMLALGAHRFEELAGARCQRRAPWPP